MLLMGLFFSVSSCDYLAVSDQMSGGLQNTDQIFENVAYTKRWYANVFAGIPDYSGINSLNVGAFKNPWAAICDELVVGYGNAAKANNSDKNAATAGFHRYGDCYKYIRQANIFLEKAHVITTSGTQGDRLEEDELNEMRANVRFMRAFYNYLLLEQYGPIILVKDKVYEATETQDVPRNTVDEVITYIDQELREVANELPQEPDRDDNKWNTALNACKDFIDYAETGNRYELYKEYTTSSTGEQILDVDASVYNLFQKYNKEIIWGTANNDWGGLDGDAFDRRIVPRCEKNGFGSTAVTQELVDAFYMNDGLPIKETDYLPKSTLYKEDGYGTYKDKNDGKYSKNYTNVTVSNRYLNREARFYNTVFFNGRQWPVTCKQVQFYNGGNAGVQEGQATTTGYMLFKRFNRSISKTSPGVASQNRPSIIFRLADFYLIYAEVANEVNPSDSRVMYAAG